MGSESAAVNELKKLADQLDALNDRLEEENRRIRTAIIALADAMDELLASVDADPDVVARAREANRVARLAVST